MATSKRLVIDGDILLYRFAYANQYKIRWDEDTTSEVILPFAIAADEMERFIAGLLETVDCNDYIVALSHPRDFRFKVDPNYQANRRDRVAPLYKEPLREYLCEHHPWVQLDWLEGDDVLGLMATEQPDGVIMASIDKDLRQIPGQLYDWQREQLIKTTPEDAAFFFYMQILMGDSTDGIRGIPNVGPRKAERYLDGLYGAPEDKIWARVLDVYAAHNLTPEYALQQARLLRILRAGEYDYERRRPILWRGPHCETRYKPHKPSNPRCN